ncbi:protein SPT2 homolog [Linepithema humile]|uniref:protein SPT2 homolog n=1 Tax=Linepithema humile TaxID=83485 RepID=UPI0006232E5C|nr:PREDICTED: protein SPT2 homolog [Linepithema humile]
MDFGALLSVAQKNETKKQTAPCYQTKFAPPKKQSKQSKNLSDNIKKFLARKEEEEKQKALEEKRKKENLLALRDHKTQSRINKHLKVCKAANKSVIADAIDRENTAITMAGPSQPDEDDYGYESQAASALYTQWMNKYNNSSTSEKFIFTNSEKRTIKDIASTKDRVKQALKQQELEESNGHRRKRKSCTLEIKEANIEEKTQDDGDDDIKEDINEKPKQKKKPLPPPMGFAELLKLAEKKQYEPVAIEAKPKIEEERLMTKRQKEEYIQEKERRAQREKKDTEVNKKTSITNTPSKSTKPQLNKVLKSNEKSQISNATSPKSITATPKSITATPKSITATPKIITATSKKTIDKFSDKHSAEKSVSNKSPSKNDLLEERKKLEAEKRELEEMRRAIEEEKRKLALSKTKQENIKSHSSNKVMAKLKTVDKQVPAKDIKPRQNPSSDSKLYSSLINNKPKQLLQSDDISMKLKKVKRPLVSNKRRICDNGNEDDEDSDMNDFIDDEPEENIEDYSKHISEIFGYDRSKYNYIDDEDDTAMESNFAQQLKEEYRSAKIGIMEDLEDMRMEAKQKKQKAFLKQKVKK